MYLNFNFERIEAFVTLFFKTWSLFPKLHNDTYILRQYAAFQKAIIYLEHFPKTGGVVVGHLPAAYDQLIIA